MVVSPDTLTGVGAAAAGVEGAGLVPPPMPKIDVASITPPPESINAADAAAEALEADIDNFTDPTYDPIGSIENLAANPLSKDNNATPLEIKTADSDQDVNKKHPDGEIQPGQEKKIADDADAALAENGNVKPAAQLEDPGEFDEAAVRANLDADHQIKNLTDEEKNARVNEARSEHDKKKGEYKEQQNNRTPEEKRDELLQKAKQGTLTAEEAKQLNDAKVEIKNRDELASLEQKMQSKEPLNENEMKKYQELKNNSEQGTKPTETEAQALEKQSQSIVENIRNGEGNMLENVLELEGIQRKMRGETLSKSMRKILADALQSSIEGGDLDNNEAETVMEKISQLYGLEMQMAQLPDQYKQFENQADKLDKEIDKDKNNIKFDKSQESAKRRQEMYANYQRLTMVEAQMAQLMVIDQKLKLKFQSTLNQLDFTLGRKNIISYAVKGLSNAGNKHVINARTPNLRSTRHRNILGF